MTTQAKKDKELMILRTVFKKKRFRKYTFSEKPDFIMHTRDDFGVEITEYYPDETTARLHNFADYTGKVTEGIYVHKDDLGKLESVMMEYFNKKKQKWIKLDAQAVRQENKSIQERILILVKQISDKSSLMSTYNSSLASIDLIVYDSRTALIDGTNDAQMRLAMKEIRESGYFSNSGFRNIYLSIPGYRERSSEVILLK